MIKKLVIISLLIVVALIYANLKIDLAVLRHQRPYVYDNSYLLPSSQAIQSFALNYRTAAADLLWLNAVQHAGSSYRFKRSTSDITIFADTIADLDPFFHQIYWWHSGVRIHLSLPPSPKDIAEANRILKRGLEAFPDHWEFAQMIVANYIGYSKGLDRETRLRQLEDAAYYAELAASSPNSPDDLALVATSFHRKVARMRAGYSEADSAQADATPEEIEFLTRLYFDTSSPETRLFIERRLSEANADHELIAKVQQWQTQFADVHKSMEYIPSDLFTILALELYDPNIDTSPRVFE